MNRPALALVSAVVVLIAAGAWWLSSGEVAEAPAPAVLEQIPSSRGLPLPMDPIASAPTTPPAQPPPPAHTDAGGLADVEIEVVDDGQRLVGTRVELQGPGGIVSRPTDVMGFARFTLEEGLWRVTQPRRRNVKLPRVEGESWRDQSKWAALELAHRQAYTTPLEVRAPLTRLRLELPGLRELRGRVIDQRGNAVFGAEVTCRASEIELASIVTRTGPSGTFSCETRGDQVFVQASLGEARSPMRSVRLPGAAELILEPWARLRVDVMGLDDGPSGVRVYQGGSFATEGSSEEPLLVPLGNVDLLARKSARGRAFTGRAFAKVMADQKNHVVVYLQPSPPLRGRLVDAGGRPVAGVEVRADEIDMTTTAELPDGGVFWRVFASGSTTTNHAGDFSLSPPLRCCVDPIFRVTVLGLWRASRHVLVRFDDAPLEVVVEPVQ